MIVHIAKTPTFGFVGTFWNRAMRHTLMVLLFTSLFISTGCSSTPKPTPNCDIPAPMEEIGQAVSVPQMPVATSSTSDSATFDFAGIAQITKVRIAAETNKTVANENALALEARNAEVNALIECARWQNVWIDVHAEDLKDEKRAHFIDNLKYQLAIGVGVIAVIL